MSTGSQFTIRFPWYPMTQRYAETPKDLTPEDALDLTREPPLILLAEDHDETLTALSGYFTARGYRVTVARNEKETCERISEDRPALLVLDMQMPESHEIQIIRGIRADPENMSLPIVAITALCLPGDRERCLAAGANDYRCKPLGMNDLNEIIEQYLTC
jgi:CheY-like chemotaxis protein